MAMKWFLKLRENYTNYGLSKELRENGVDITVSGLNNYSRSDRRLIRLDVLAAMRYISGYSWEDVGALIDADFLPKKLRNKE